MQIVFFSLKNNFWKVRYFQICGVQTRGVNSTQNYHTAECENPGRNILMKIKAYLILLHFTLLSFTGTVFYKLKVCGNPVKQVYWRHFSNSICSLHVSVSHFGNSCNISNFFIIIIFVMVTCDQWSVKGYQDRVLCSNLKDE